jgi:O-antigen/teichoic acid export membrane protein
MFLPVILPLLFGAAFAPAVPLAIWLVLAYILLGLNGVLCDGFRGLGSPNWVNFSECVGLLIRVVLFPAIVFHFSFTWLAIGTAIAAGLTLITSILVAHVRLAPWKWDQLGQDIYQDFLPLLRNVRQFLRKIVNEH